MGIDAIVAALSILTLTSCGGSSDDYAVVEPPPPVVRADSNLYIFDAYGTKKLLFLKGLGTLVSDDESGLVAHVPENMSLTSRLYAGEIGTNGTVCDIFGCYVLPEDQWDYVTDKLSVYLMGPEEVTSVDPMGDSIIAVIEAHSANGGVSETFIIDLSSYAYGDIGTFEAELFNMDGPLGNGFTEATMITVKGTGFDGNNYAWATTFGTDPWIDPTRTAIASYTGEMRGLFIFEGGSIIDVSGDVNLNLDFDSMVMDGQITSGAFPDITLLPSTVSPENSLVLIGSAEMAPFIAGEDPTMTGDYLATVFGGGTEVGGSLALTGETTGLTGAFVAAE